ncbi:response regulator transcription factor [Butyrivibrio sp. WCD3002]|uniref:response regulator transcription factor n=1 Tax=Butyrivibrio sp. WCD3002 TaxID=1280676 RepID=UPI0003FFD124|nr:response regulator [Butyrivibrio sp. WCD3002]
MRSLLIVEDEKLIRQGIRTMAERSGVKINEIYEANNGEAALEILRSHRIEVMFTDIRMPRMDGVELVHNLKSLGYMPYVVAISGFDDFSYAVEMLRNGATEYLLKPIEREKIKEILTTLNEKINEKEKAKGSGSYDKLLREEAYGVAFFAEESLDQIENDLIRIPGMTNAAGVLLTGEQAKIFPEEYESIGAGLSRLHQGDEELKFAVAEAVEARSRAFCIEKSISVDEPKPSVSEKLQELSKELLSENKRTRRIQMLSTENHLELIKNWGALFDETRRGRIAPELFIEEMKKDMQELRDVYQQVMSEDDIEKSRALELPLAFATISDYEDEVITFLIELSKRLLQVEDEEPMQRKINQAISYIKEHYSEDMNMATVSNYISMNYTLFSYSFKQYTGQNFVTFLKEIRLKAARDLLEKTDEKIIDVAHRVGYENEKHFLKTFKGEFGVSPGEYRRNMQRKEAEI